MIKFNLPKEVDIVFDTLSRNGYEGYLVGGCIRDLIMKKTPVDYDFAVSSLPDKTEECFKDYKVFKTGLKHGTITVKINRLLFELTTFRVDGEYLDARRPSHVDFTSSLAEDLKRRDFTMNAIAYNHEKGIVDLFGGKSDIENKLIDCVGNHEERFSEDALRIMRALRFASVLGFSLTEDTKKAIHEKKHLLEKIASERIYQELNKLISGNPDYVFENFKDVFTLILPGFSSTIKLDELPRNLYLRYALITCSDDLKNIKADNLTVNTVKELHYIKKLDINNRTEFLIELGKLKYVSYDLAEEYLSVMSGNLCEKLNELFSYARKGCISANQLAVNGFDLLSCGVKPGKQVSIILNKLLEEVISGAIHNEKNTLIKRAAELITGD